MKNEQGDVTLAMFVDGVKRDLIRFEHEWKMKNKNDPVTYPMKINADDAGMWWEFFMMEKYDDE